MTDEKTQKAAEAASDLSDLLGINLRNLMHRLQPFITTQSGSDVYKVVLQFSNIHEMHEFHRQLLSFIDVSSIKGKSGEHIEIYSDDKYREYVYFNESGELICESWTSGEDGDSSNVLNEALQFRLYRELKNKFEA